MIHDLSSEQKLERHARTLGPSIRKDGVRLVLKGMTTLEEVLRVTLQFLLRTQIVDHAAQSFVQHHRLVDAGTSRVTTSVTGRAAARRIAVSYTHLTLPT